LGIGLAREINVANTKTGAFEQRIERAKDLVRDVLKDEESFHGKNYNGPRKIIEIGETLCRTEAWLVAPAISE